MSTAHDSDTPQSGMSTAHDSDTLVVVTGATGYIGAHIVQQAQQAGYRVRGTVRSLDTDKVDFLYHLCPNAVHPVELVKADLADADCWNGVIRGAAYVIHAASPVPSAIQHKNVKEDDIVVPARDGTINVLKACVAAGTVKRVVVTSSVNTIGDGGTAGLFSEEDWENPDNVTNSYTKSKLLAERAAWDFVDALPEKDKIELATIQPGIVFGPLLNNILGASTEIIKSLFKKEMRLVPHMYAVIADVRDVAACHISAIVAPGAEGHRHICTSGAMWLDDVAKLLKEEFGPQGYSIPTKRCPYFLMWIMSRFNQLMIELLKRIDVEQNYDNTRMRQVLGVTPSDMKESIIETGYALIERGFVPKTSGYRGPSTKQLG